MEIFHIRAAILFIGAFLDAVLLLFLWLKTKSKPAFHFGWSVLFSILYCFSYGARFAFEHNKIFWTRASWIGMLIMPGFIAFSYSLYEKRSYFKLKIFLWYLVGAAILIISVTTPYIVKEVKNEYPYLDTPGFLEPFTRVYLLLALLVGWFWLLKHYFRSEKEKRLQLKYFILGIGIHSIGGLIAAAILPLIYPKFNYVDISAVLTVPGVFLVTYGFLKRKLFEIRVFLTEILVVMIAIILLIQALLAQTLAAKTLSSVTFFSFLLVGYLLIKVTQREIQRKEQAEILTKQLKHLNETLEDKVKQRTKDLEKSYQEIKERKDELERFYNLTVGRELKMLELKEKIKELRHRPKEKKIIGK